MRILITGGTGLVGAAVARRCVEVGHEVHALVALGKPVPDGCCYLGRFGDEHADLTRIDWAALPPIDVLCHQAAVTDPGCTDMALLHRANVDEPMILFRQAQAHGVRRIVVASCASVYGDYGPDGAAQEEWQVQPATLQAASKAELDDALALMGWQVGGVPVVGLRYGSVYGPGEAHKGERASLVSRCHERMVRGERPRLERWGGRLRDRIAVEDVAAANLVAMQPKAPAGLYNIGTGTATSDADVVRALNEAMGTDLPPVFVPVLVGDRRHDGWECLDIRKAARELCWGPLLPLEAGVRRFVGEMRKARETVGAC